MCNLHVNQSKYLYYDFKVNKRDHFSIYILTLIKDKTLSNMYEFFVS